MYMERIIDFDRISRFGYIDTFVTGQQPVRNSVTFIEQQHWKVKRLMMYMGRIIDGYVISQFGYIDTFVTGRQPVRKKVIIIKLQYRNDMRLMI